MRENGVLSVFHYLSLNKSPFYKHLNAGELVNSDLFSERLIRLPFYYELSEEEQDKIVSLIKQFFKY